MTARIHVIFACAALLAAIVGCGDDTSGDASSGSGNAGGESAGGGGPGGSGMGGSAGGATLLNGCSAATAEDKTGAATLDMAAWTLGHQQCVTVDVGTAVTWTGSFTSHPLSGGPTGTADAASPISTSDQSGASATVTFSAAGEFPYFCLVHNAGMQGVVYVE